ncbi:multidrug efflux SMR transporter [Ktedonosporobacter rubrisoli]|uniref:Multidrug efflux SMR transporter n=1 Tax=Ktedonosporobacter rubrisoli TaxID=2509675 RepID=A0A4P6JS59_KTERU|nr:multidrug efflux SMR transporter [Ktedonosporobacter rubrisoli]QBD78358.1 multidrug efflux SMR transporter [Ktedonosporobacter rubrisoli]
MRKEWILLFLTGVLEAVWVSGIKHAATWWEWLITIASILVSFKVLFDVAAKLPLGTMYAVFTGLGTVATVITEIIFFGEQFNPLKLLFIAALLAGVMGLKFVTNDGEKGKSV